MTSKIEIKVLTVLALSTTHYNSTILIVCLTFRIFDGRRASMVHDSLNLGR